MNGARRYSQARGGIVATGFSFEGVMFKVVIETEFNNGQSVRLRANNQRVGYVYQLLVSGPLNQVTYAVTWGDTTSTYHHAFELEPDDATQMGFPLPLATPPPTTKKRNKP